MQITLDTLHAVLLVLQNSDAAQYDIQKALRVLQTAMDGLYKFTSQEPFPNPLESEKPQMPEGLSTYDTRALRSLAMHKIASLGLSLFFIKKKVRYI